MLTKIIAERDTFRSDTADLLKSKKAIEKTLAFTKLTSKERESKLKKQLASMTKENNDHMDEIITLQKSCK